MQERKRYDEGYSSVDLARVVEPLKILLCLYVVIACAYVAMCINHGIFRCTPTMIYE